MTRILYVEDDALISRLYMQKLVEAGFDVTLAEDGLQAIKRLAEFRPDVVVLDLLLPKMNGADVLKFMRESPALRSVPVIVFSNAFLSALAQEAAAAKVESALIKAAATPAKLVATLRDIMTPPAGLDSKSGDHSASSIQNQEGDASGDDRVEKEFFKQTPVILKNLLDTCRKFIDVAEPAVEHMRMEDLTRKVGFLAQMTSMAGCHHLSQLASALEAMLFDLRDKAAPPTESSRHTIITSVVYLADQLDSGRQPAKGRPHSGSVLVVDDDSVSGRAVVQALNRAGLRATSLADPFDALKQLEQSAYDLVLLDVDMPGMSGIAVCEQMRTMPNHKHTPVVFVTGLKDFRTRALSLLTSGNDAITKPVQSLELTVKALTMLLRNSRAS